MKHIEVKVNLLPTRRIWANPSCINTTARSALAPGSAKCA